MNRPSGLFEMPGPDECKNNIVSPKGLRSVRDIKSTSGLDPGFLRLGFTLQVFCYANFVLLGEVWGSLRRPWKPVNELKQSSECRNTGVSSILPQAL